jgi:hypothetical protein
MSRLPRLIRAAVTGVLLTALLMATGAHWAVLQSVAWARMMADYSHGTSLAEAARKTFDGAHPCPLCKRIATENHAPKKPEAAVSAERLTLLCEAVPSLLPPGRTFWILKADGARFHMRNLRPSVPPPRTPA